MKLPLKMPWDLAQTRWASILEPIINFAANQSGQVGKVLSTDGTTTKWITAGEVTGLVPISAGGTGQITQVAAITALAGPQAAGQYLRSNGVTTALTTIQAGDVPTLNQNTTGSAGSTAKWTTPRNLAGNAVDGSADVAFSNKFIVQGTTDAGLSGAQFLGALGTGIIKNTTTTGVLSIAIAGDFPTLNQNTTGTATNITATSNSTLTTLSSLSLPLSQTTGVLAISQGGTGQSSASAAFNAISPLTSSGDLLTYGSGTNSRLGTAPGDTGKPLISGGGSVSNSWNVLGFSGGGTGAVTQQAAMNALAGAVTNAQFLRGNGTNIVMASISAGDVPTLNQNTTGTASNVTGTVAIANGGTGQITASAAFNALSPLTSSGDLLTYGSGTNSRLGTGPGDTGKPLISGGGSVPNSWNVLGIEGGGTGQTTKAAAYDALSPNTTKGDIEVFAATNTRMPVGTDGQVIQADSSQTLGVKWTTLQQGAKNYITYNNFENNATTGWSLGTVGTLTNGIPTGSPTFGSGASGNLSIAAVSSGQLAGAYSLSLVSSAATTLGNMLATQAYTIDAEDQAKVLTFKFYYSAFSGTTNCNFSGTKSNSFGVAIYDVTNSVWLTSTANFGMVQGSGIGYCTGTCQTNATTASLRFVIYNANATAGAATLYFDDFFLGPQTAPMGPAMTDWKNDKTFTPSAGFGTVSSTNYWYRRIGDSAEVTLIFTSGTAAASTASIALPFTIDSTKLPSSSTVVGTAFREVNSASRTMWSNNDPAVVFYDGSTTGSVYLTNADGAQTLTKTNVSSMFSTGDLLSVTFTVPVSGWSSNSVMSSDTDTRVVAFQGAVNQTINNTTPSLTPTVNYDTHGAFATSTYTVPVTGKYHLHGWLRSPSIAWTAGQTIEIYYSKNGGANITVGRTVMTATTNIAQASFSDMVDAKAGDTLLLKAYSDVSGTFTGNYNIDRLSGPAVVAATESVNARYTNTSGQSITNTGADVKITGWTKDFDTHNAVSGDTYTCPVSGKYAVSATVNYASSLWAASNQVALDVYKNGAAHSYGPIVTAWAAVTTQLATKVDTEINCNTGDTIDVRTANTRGAGATALASNGAQVFFTVMRVGN